MARRSRYSPEVKERAVRNGFRPASSARISVVSDLIDRVEACTGETVIRKKENRPEAADYGRSNPRNQRRIDFLRSTTPAVAPPSPQDWNPISKRNAASSAAETRCLLPCPMNSVRPEPSVRDLTVLESLDSDRPGDWHDDDGARRHVFVNLSTRPDGGEYGRHSFTLRQRARRAAVAGEQPTPTAREADEGIQIACASATILAYHPARSARRPA